MYYKWDPRLGTGPYGSSGLSTNSSKCVWVWRCQLVTWLLHEHPPTNWYLPRISTGPSESWIWTALYFQIDLKFLKKLSMRLNEIPCFICRTHSYQGISQKGLCWDMPSIVLSVNSIAVKCCSGSSPTVNTGSVEPASSPLIYQLILYHLADILNCEILVAYRMNK